MLTATTKNRINTCRDILVGKIPDPKGQIDQITNALVYKFMDDQDRMSRELGYKVSFFTGEYEQYAWSNLFDTKLTNQERANLYIEGLDKLSRADHLPELFKQIFKDAYLPFRDANTIVMFLTEINGFDYHHSEELGNAFEYLLSIMGSQGDAGQFRTPRHIIEFLVDVVDPQKTETILDPACGTAGFLVEAFKHISEKGDLGVKDVAKLAESITGVDIDPGMAKIARVNLYLHGFKTPKITENDTLTDEKLWGHKYDVILANPPFMTPKGGIQPHDKFAIRANRAEVLFTDYIAEHLKLHGRAGIIVPEGIIFQSSNAYKDLRKMLVDDGYLWAVVSLPAGCFNPYSGVKTSILFLDRDRAKTNDSVLFVKISNDGYDLGAQRREGGKNDLPKSLEILNKFKDNPKLNLEKEPLAHLVEKTKIAESGDHSLSGDRYIISSSPVNTEYEIVELGNKNYFDLYQPQTITSKDILEYGPYKVYGANGVIGYYTQFNHSECEVLVTCRGATCGAINFSEPNSWITGNAMVVSPNNAKVNKKYIYYLLKNTSFKSVISGAAQPQITRQGLSPLGIPLPPLEIQEQIVAELDGYQRIIEGARAVFENYKPTIKIDLEWEIVKIGDIAKVQGGFAFKSEEMSEESGIQIIKIGNVKDLKFNPENNPSFVKEELFTKYSEYQLSINDILISMTGTAGKRDYGNVCMVDTNGKFLLNQRVGRIVPNGTINRKYLFFILNHPKTKDNFYSNTTGGVRQGNISNKQIESINISLPTLEIQQSIVDRIEEEQRLVDANRRLIEIYEGKIKEKMDEVWGVGK